MQRLLWSCALALLSSSAIAQPVAAQAGNVYKCTFANGQVQFTIRKCPDGARSVIVTTYKKAAANAPQSAAPVDTEADLTSHKHYTNHAGGVVHSPSTTISHTVPAGASAVCGDRTYSFSRSRRGTCSHHGGVARWL
jgi:hypothetical protein